MNKITLVPAGGIANRMRAIAAAIALSKEIGSSLEVIWFKYAGLNCSFRDIFEEIEMDGVVLKEAKRLDLLLHDRPLRENLRIPYLFQQFIYDSCLYEQHFLKMFDEGFDFKRWAQGRNVFMTSYSQFHNFPNELFSELFRPVEAIRRRIEECCSKLTSNCIGIHIRRTDNVVSIHESPTDLFVSTIEHELQKNPGVNFYLATDSEEDKNLLCSRFGSHIITSDKVARRNTAEGVRDAVVDLYVLSQTNRIYGSSGSSFTEMASYLNGSECVVLK